MATPRIAAILSEAQPQTGARDEILEPALTLFIRPGLDGSTIRLIARQAKVSPGLIHPHCQDKETL